MSRGIPFLKAPSIDDRLQKLPAIKADLQASISAVEELERKALGKKQEVMDLEVTIQRLHEDKLTAEAILSLPEDSLTRALARATRKGRWRGVLEGVVIGFLTGVASSLLVWYLTKP